MRFLAKTILVVVVVIALCTFLGVPARAFWLSFPGVGIDVLGPHGSVSFPYGEVRWGPHGGAVVFPGGKVKWRAHDYYTEPPSWHHWDSHRR